MIKKACFSRLFISIICVLLMLEIGIRVLSTKLSSNIEHISDIPAIAIDAAGETNDTVLVMGNSLIGNAVNIKQFNVDVNRGASANISAYKVVPDATALWDWYCITKNNFTGTKKSPDAIIIGFAWWQLENRERVQPSRLSAFFCGAPDVVDLYQAGMNRTSDVLEYLAASVSRLYAMREVIHKRILDLFIYKYRSNARYTNTVSRAAQRTTNISEVTTPQDNHKLLSRYLELLSENNITPIFVVMPVVDDYRLDLDTVSLIEQQGGIVYDFRYMADIQDEMYIDSIHLGETGSHIFTGKLADEVNSRPSGLFKNVR